MQQEPKIITSLINRMLLSLEQKKRAIYHNDELTNTQKNMHAFEIDKQVQRIKKEHAYYVDSLQPEPPLTNSFADIIAEENASRAIRQVSTENIISFNNPINSLSNNKIAHH